MAKHVAKRKRPRLIRRKCFLCRKSLRGTQSNKDHQQFDEGPVNATVWTSRGNFGSTVLDMEPADQGFLELSICDKCFQDRRGLINESPEYLEQMHDK